MYEATVSAAAYLWYCSLGAIQGAAVLLPGVVRSRLLAALRARWLLVMLPVAAATGATFLPSVDSVLANDLSTLALVAVPLLAALALGWAMRPRHVALVVLVPALFGLAWADPGGRAGDAAGLVLVVLSSVGLAAIVVAIVPRLVVKAGICVWAAADLSVALAHRLEQASHAITHALPVAGPQLQLQRAVLGSASMEWADFFIAAVLGAVLAAQERRRGRAALLVAVLAMISSAFFLVTNVLPATVPVALALVIDEVWVYLFSSRAPSRRKMIRVPPSPTRSAVTSPPCASATCRTMASPSPDPGMPRAERAR